MTERKLPAPGGEPGARPLLRRTRAGRVSPFCVPTPGARTQGRTRMVILAIMAGLALAGWAAGRLAMRAFRDDHLVPLRPHAREGTWLFERGGDGRYLRIT